MLRPVVGVYSISPPSKCAGRVGRQHEGPRSYTRVDTNFFFGRLSRVSVDKCCRALRAPKRSVLSETIRPQYIPLPTAACRLLANGACCDADQWAVGTTVHVRVDLGWRTAITARLATVATGRLHSLNVYRQMPSLRVEIQSSGSLATSTGSSGGAGMVLIVAEGKKTHLHVGKVLSWNAPRALGSPGGIESPIPAR